MVGTEIRVGIAGGRRDGKDRGKVRNSGREKG